MNDELFNFGVWADDMRIRITVDFSLPFSALSGSSLPTSFTFPNLEVGREI